MAGSVLLSHTLMCSIIAAEALHDRVRDGNGCYLLAMTTSQRDGSVPVFYQRSRSIGKKDCIGRYNGFTASFLYDAVVF